MIINVTDLLEKKSLNKSIDLKIEENKINDGNEDIDFTKPIVIKADMLNIGDTISLDGTISTEVLLTCSRCMDKYKYPLNFEIHEKFSDKINDDDIINIVNNKINLHEVVIENIILALPVKKLCKPDCKGLCQICGTNLNHSQCKCVNNDIDIRLSKLQDFFSSK